VAGGEQVMKTTHYFDASVMVRRPYLTSEWIDYVMSHPVHNAFFDRRFQPEEEAGS